MRVSAHVNAHAAAFLDRVRNFESKTLLDRMCQACYAKSYSYSTADVRSASLHYSAYIGVIVYVVHAVGYLSSAIVSSL